VESCRFCSIVSGDVESQIVLEDDETLAFLDSRPLFPGHSLLVPREHVETLVDLPDGLLPGLFANARLLARAMEVGMNAEGSFVAINNRVSQSVPHLHVHVVPRTKGDGLRGFFWPRQKYRDDAHAAETAERLRAAVARLGGKH
jgi:histidine triad (HIT) family protein